MKEDDIKVWFEDGIVYYSLHGDLTLETLVNSQTTLAELLKQHASKPVPMIVMADQISTENFKIRLPDFGKTLTAVNIIHFISAVWIVGASNELRGHTETLARMFLGKHLHFADNLGAAKSEASKLIGTDLSILESDE